MIKRLVKILLIPATVLLLIAPGAFLFSRQAKFGRNPEGSHLTQIARSPNFRGGEFRNLVEIPTVINKDGRVTSLIKYLFSKKERAAPEGAVPAVKVDLKALDLNKDAVVWLGHSSFYFQLGGRTILVDPVFSGQAAPVSFANRAFAGSTPYTADDFPDIDYLLITHDHWDHLDYPTVMALGPRLKNIITPLGVGAHFLYWGFPLEIIREADYYQEIRFDGLAIHALPAQHYSGRLMERNKTLWAGFALVTDKRKIFLSGDSGYGAHFEQIGQAFGGFDLALLDSGQYDPQWPFIHMTPEQAVTAARDLKAEALLPAHIGKFSIANHSWDDPFIRVSRAAASMENSFRLWTPKIGRPVYLDQPEAVVDKWWEAVN